MSTFRTSAALCAALFVASGAHAVTVDFNSLHFDGEVKFIADPLVMDGYNFANDCGDPGSCLTVLGTAFPIQSWLMDPTGASIWPNYPYTPNTITRVDGGAFNLQSIDLADGFNEGLTPTSPGHAPVPTTMMFTFDYAVGGSSTQYVTLDALPGGQTVTFNQKGLSSVSWYVTGSNPLGYSQYDNVVLTSAVPEPESLALMLAGLAALGVAARRRSRA